MPVPDPTYITASEVQAQTLIANLRTLDPADIDSLIRTAEDQIDTHVGPQRHHSEDSNINRVFPRAQDYERTNDTADRLTPVIPYQVMRATLRQVEWLYLQWWSSRATAQTPVERTVLEEDLRGDGGYSATYGAQTDFAGATLCHDARALLSSYVNRWAGISVSHPDDL